MYYRKMSSIQVRISENTHQAIKGIANETGDTMQGVVEHAIDRYKRELFLESLNRDFDSLKASDVDWTVELEERSIWEETLADGESN